MAASYKGSLLPEALLNYLRGALSRSYSLLDLLSRLSSSNEHSPFKHRRVCIPSCALAGGCALPPPPVDRRQTGSYTGLLLLWGCEKSPARTETLRLQNKKKILHFYIFFFSQKRGWGKAANTQTLRLQRFVLQLCMGGYLLCTVSLKH